MSFSIEGTDLVFDGWENGVGDSPFTGLPLVRQVNVTDSPRETYVGYDLLNQYTKPVTFQPSYNAGTDTVSYTAPTDPLTGAKIAILNGTPIQERNDSEATLRTNIIYFATNVTITSSGGIVSGGTFQIATTVANAIAGTPVVNFSNSGTFNTKAIGPSFSGFGGPTGDIAPYSATYTNASGTAFQFMADATGNENGTTYAFPGNGNIWYYMGVAGNQTGWTLMDQSNALIVTSVTSSSGLLVTMPVGSTFATGTAVQMTADTTLPTGISANTIYYVINISATTFKLATSLANALAGTAIAYTNAGSGVLIIRYAESVKGLAAWNDYLFVFRNYQVDIMKISGAMAATTAAQAAAAWTLGWNVALTTGYTAAISHRAITGILSDAIYFCNGNYVGGLYHLPGAVFDPTSAATYSWTPQALPLPTSESSISLTQLGSNILVGGIFNYIYPWDGVNPNGFGQPIFVPEQNIAEMVTVNTTTYIGAGYRGRIYQTNGSSASLYKKLPDHTTGNIAPLIYWKCFATDRNELMFGIECYDNSGVNIDGQTGEAGLWAINFDTKALRLLQIFSPGLTSSMTNMFSPFIMPIARSSSGGLSFVTGWTLQSSAVNYSGFDGFIAQGYTALGFTTGGTPDGAYNVGAAQILTDLVRVGENYTKKTFSQVEWTLSQALASGEKVQVEARSAVNGSFVVVGSTTSSGGAEISDTYTANFENYIWLQLRVTLYSVAFGSSPSYVRLRDLRVR